MTGKHSIDGLISAEHRGLYVGGRWRAAAEDRRLDVVDPADARTLTDVADASVEDAVAGLDAAVAAQADWARTVPRERAELLRRAFDLLTERADAFAWLMSLEMGKPLAEAKGEVSYAADFLRWFSEEAVRIHGVYMRAPAGGSRLLTVRKPVGPCLFITPWNFPLAMATRKIAPAIAAGCTMVIKPASETPLTMHAFVALLEEVGLPGGVLNLVTTSGSGRLSERLMADPRLRKVSFTGSTGVGQQLVRQSADRLQRMSMELGGNAPFLVFADADLDAAVEGAMLAKMRNMGEACTAANRFLVEESIAEEFSAALASRMSALTVGRGQDEGVDVGPLITEKAVEKVTGLVGSAVEDGATVVVQGQAPDTGGYFYPATVLTEVPHDSQITREEIFGPVAAISTFATEQEAVLRANDSEYGLSSYVFTRDLERALRLGEELDFGMVGLNTGLVSNAAAPFGGVKASGFGREGGFEGIDEYLETTYLAISMA